MQGLGAAATQTNVLVCLLCPLHRACIMLMMAHIDSLTLITLPTTLSHPLPLHYLSGLHYAYDCVH